MENGNNGNGTLGGLDALLPPDMAKKAEEIGVKKANLDVWSTLVLAILAGAFIAQGALFATTAWTDTVGKVPWGLARILGGMAFTLGLVLVVVGGAELFTGNNLLVMAWANRRISTPQLLRNWGIVYVGNLIGSVGTAVIVVTSQRFVTMANGGIGLTALNIANSKVHLGFTQAIALGILCNALVCLAVWMTYSARSTLDRIAVIILPISAFVAAGFEHSVANMYFIPVAIFIKIFAPGTFWQGIGKLPADFADLTWSSFLYKNLLPVTIGNIIGGALLVGAVYWLVYLRKPAAAKERIQTVSENLSATQRA
jgi:formate transporter